MNTTTRNQPELSNLGVHLSAARARLKLTQRQLSSRCRVDQATIVRIERGIRLPTVPQLVQLAHALDVSLQWFLTGSNWPDLEPAGLAVELRNLGIVDLLVTDAVVPGAFRPPEQVVSLSVRGDEPEPVSSKPSRLSSPGTTGMRECAPVTCLCLRRQTHPSPRRLPISAASAPTASNRAAVRRARDAYRKRPAQTRLFLRPRSQHW